VLPQSTPSGQWPPAAWQPAGADAHNIPTEASAMAPTTPASSVTPVTICRGPSRYE